MEIQLNGKTILIDIVKNNNITIVRLYKSKDEGVNDGSYPKEEYGYLCYRENYKWLVSGLISKKIAANEKDINFIIYKIAELFLNLDDSLSIAVDIMSSEYAFITNGEEDDRFYKGSVDDSEWKKI